MKFIQGKDRKQLALFPGCLDEALDSDNEARLIDLYVDSLDLVSFGFDMDFIDNGHRPIILATCSGFSFTGILTGYALPRALEKECKRNIELIWLLKGLVPDHNTISNFRRDNPKAIKKVFRSTVQIAKHFNLIGGKLIAGDSTKMRTQNSKKNNFNQKKIDRHIAYIDTKVEEYNKELAAADDNAKKQLKQEIQKYNQRKENYKQLQNQLKESGLPQVSTSDPESRQMITRNNITEVVYNVQSTVDAKNNLPIDYKVTNNNDSKAMGNMLQRAKSILRSNDFTALYDKGYHTGSEFKTAYDLGIDVMVAIPAVAAQAPNPEYNVDKFEYNQDGDYYLCPQGQKLTTSGTLHNAKTYQFKRYTTEACLQCPVKEQCSKAKYGKGVQRSEYQAYINQNKDRINKNKDYYRRRQAMVEHPYGTIKRQWGFNYILTKKFKERATADVGLMFIAYNLRRLITILGKKSLRDYLQLLIFSFLSIFSKVIEVFSCFKPFFIASKIKWPFYVTYSKTP